MRRLWFVLVLLAAPAVSKDKPTKDDVERAAQTLQLDDRDTAPAAVAVLVKHGGKKAVQPFRHLEA